MEATKVVELKRGHYGYGLKLEKISGKYNKSAKIIRVKPNSFEEEAGLTVGDYLLRINDAPVHGLSYNELMNIIRGSPGDSIILHINSSGTNDSFNEDESLVMRDKRCIESLRFRESNSPRNSRRQSMTFSCQPQSPRTYLNVPRRRHSDCILNDTDEMAREGYIQVSTPADKSSDISSQHSFQHSNSSITQEDDCCPRSADSNQSTSLSPSSPHYFNALSSNLNDLDNDDASSKLDNISQSSIQSNILDQSENSVEELPRYTKKAAYSPNVETTASKRIRETRSELSSARRKGGYGNLDSQPKIQYKPRRSNEPLNKVSYTPKVSLHTSLDTSNSGRIIRPKPISELAPLQNSLDNISFSSCPESTVKPVDSLQYSKIQPKNSVEPLVRDLSKDQGSDVLSGSKKHKLHNLAKFWTKDKREFSESGDCETSKPSSFSLPLQDHIPSTFCEYIPYEMELCVKIVEMFGLYMEGIYRRNPNFSALKELTSYLDKDLQDIDCENEKWNDVYLICGLLKSFIRQLPELLLPDDIRENLLKCCKDIDQTTECVQRMKFYLDCLRDSRTLTRKPLCDHHYQSLKYLIRHLVKVAQYHSKNMMNAYNLAVVFFPNLLSTPDLTTDDRDARIKVVQLMIEYSKWMFSSNDHESEPHQDDWVKNEINIPEEEDVEKQFDEPRQLVQEIVHDLLEKRSPTSTASFNLKSDHKKSSESIWKYKGHKEKRKTSTSDSSKPIQSNSLATPLGDKAFTSSSSSDLSSHTTDYLSSRILRISLPKSSSSTPTLRKSVKSHKCLESSLMSCASSSSTDRIAKRWGLLLPEDGDTLVRRSAEAMQAIARNISQSSTLVNPERKSVIAGDNLPAVPESDSQEFIPDNCNHSSESSGELSPISPKKPTFLNRGSSKRSSLPQNTMPISPRLLPVGDTEDTSLPSTFHLQRPSLAPAKSIEVLYPSPEEQALEKPPLLEVDKTDVDVSRPLALLETPL